MPASGLERRTRTPDGEGRPLARSRADESTPPAGTSRRSSVGPRMLWETAKLRAMSGTRWIEGKKTGRCRAGNEGSLAPSPADRCKASAGQSLLQLSPDSAASGQSQSRSHACCATGTMSSSKRCSDPVVHHVKKHIDSFSSFVLRHEGLSLHRGRKISDEPCESSEMDPLLQKPARKQGATSPSVTILLAS